MKTTIKNYIMLATLATIIIASCKKDKNEVPTPEPPANEEEVITTIRLLFTDSAGVAPSVTAEYRDPDGDGGNPAVQFDTIHLNANTTYYAEVLLLNETTSPADTISHEVEEEANDHLFIYTPTGINTTISIEDYDTNTPPLPLGLQTKWKTTIPSSGEVQIVLKHQPEVKDGTAAPGETDIDVTFQAIVQ